MVSHCGACRLTVIRMEPLTGKRTAGTVTKKARSNRPRCVGVIIRGSRNKIKYDPSSRQFKLSKVMPEGMVFPYDFGFVPSTKSGDGDPLDVLVLTDDPLFPGCLVECSLIGALKTKQKEKRRTNRNDRLIAVADQSVLYSDIKTLKELNPKALAQIEAFFVNYQKVRGVEVTILGYAGPREAKEILARSRSSHLAKRER